jgi:multidrug transporter EmrE-like cation transporter
MELWVILISFATVINILWVILMKYLTKIDKSFIIILYMFLFIGIFSLFILIYLHFFSTISIKPKNIFGIILLASSIFVSNILLGYAITHVNNQSYIRSFVALEIAILFIIFSYYNEEELNIGKMFGIFSVIIGIILLSFS